jgi:hypothetical protein
MLKFLMNYPAAELRGIRCHAGLDKPAPAIRKPGASSLDFWIPTFILLWRISRDDDAAQAPALRERVHHSMFNVRCWTFKKCFNLPLKGIFSLAGTVEPFRVHR